MTNTIVMSATEALNLTKVMPITNKHRKNLSIGMSLFNVSTRSLASDKTIATGVHNDAKGLHYPYFIDLHAFYRKNQTGFQLKKI